jgi:hypothetical protein
MPSRAKKLDGAIAKLPSIPKELVAQFLTGPIAGEAINAAGGMVFPTAALVLPQVQAARRECEGAGEGCIVIGMLDQLPAIRARLSIPQLIHTTPSSEYRRYR